MSPLAALRAGTTVNAGLLGMQGQISTVADGAVADVIAFPGAPRQNLRTAERVLFVMKEGTVLRQGRAARRAARSRLPVSAREAVH